jgi:hypothetical protein
MTHKIQVLRQLALAFPKTTEAPHFEKTSFRVGKKIFATCDLKSETANLKLNPIDQSVFCSMDKSIIYPVPNKWGLHGWTTVELAAISQEMLADILSRAYATVASKGGGNSLEEQ